MSKQKAPTTKSDSAYWDYEGSHEGTEFFVKKLETHSWEGAIEKDPTRVEGEKKREVVNALVDKIENRTSSTKKSSYKEDMYDGVPVFSVALEKETEYTFDERKQVTTGMDLETFLGPFFESKDRESFVVVLMDSGNSIIGLHELSVGGLDATVVDVKNVMKIAILANASKIALAHNHPSGNPEPSQNDIRITRQLVEAGDTMDIPVLDHLVFGDYVTSLRERGVIS